MPRIKQGEHSVKTYGRRRCRYCDKMFTKTKPNKVFCSLLHQKAYNSEGMALGPLREKLPKWISKEVTKQLACLLGYMTDEQRAKLMKNLITPQGVTPGEDGGGAGSVTGTPTSADRFLHTTRPTGVSG